MGHEPFYVALTIAATRGVDDRKPTRRWFGASPNSAPSAPAEAFVDGVARAAHGADRVAFAALRQPFAQTADVHVDRAFVDLCRSPPYQVEQLGAREHPARRFEQIFQQPEVG